MSASYEYYKIFYYVAKYHSFNKAASVMSNSQPNISRSISNLEAELGCKLFIRSPKGVTLTDAGEKLFTHVEAACRHLEAGEDIVKATSELKHGTITIGFSTGLTAQIMLDKILPAIHTFHEKYPDVHLKITHASTLSMLSDISNNLMDIAFITSSYGEGSEGRDYHKIILHSYHDIFIAGHNYSELADRQVSLRELMDYPFISLWNGTETYNYYHSFFAEHGLEFKPSVETTSTGQALIYTVENLGIGCIHPKDAAQALDDKLIFKINLKEKLPKRYIAMIRSNEEKNAAIILEKLLLEHRES